MAVFVIGVIDSIQDEAGFIAYQQKAGPTLAPFGGQVIAGGSNIELADGDFSPGRHGGHSIRNNGQRQSLVQRSSLQQRQTRSFEVRHQQHDLPTTRLKTRAPPLNLVRLRPRPANGPATSSSFPGWIRRYFPRTFTLPLILLLRLAVCRFFPGVPTAPRPSRRLSCSLSGRSRNPGTC